MNAEGTRRLSAPPASDVLIAAVLAAASIVQVLLDGDVSRSLPLLLALSVLSTTPLAWRRTAPLASAVTVSLFVAILLAGDHPEFLAGNLLALAFSVYSAAAYEGRALVATIPLVIGVVAVTLGESQTAPLFGWFAATAATLGAAWLLGRALRRQREREAELRTMASQLEAQRDRTAEVAALEERSRIARELHDVVAHSISVITVQAAAANATLDTDPEGARDSLEAIEEASRQTQAELARMLHVLRGGVIEPDQGQPGLERLSELVREVEAAGTHVRLQLDGTGGLPRALDLNAYRIAQEALTNVRKHAGPGASAEVTVRSDPDVLGIVVRDDGVGTAGGGSDDGGHGLVGMRERARLFGGTISAAEAPGGGFEVRVEIPRSRP